MGALLWLTNPETLFSSVKWELVRLNYQIKIEGFLEVRQLSHDHAWLLGNRQNMYLHPGPHPQITAASPNHVSPQSF